MPSPETAVCESGSCDSPTVVTTDAGVTASEVGSPAPPAAGGDEGKRDLPVILPLPPSPKRTDGVLTLSASITCARGTGKVTLWARGERDTTFRAFPMFRGQGDVFTVNLKPWSRRGRSVRYFIEAWDAAGGGPRRAGDATTPFLAELSVPARGEIRTLSRFTPWAMGLTGTVLVLLFIVRAIVRREREVVRRGKEEAFWDEQLAALAGKTDLDLSLAVTRLCSREVHHPTLGWAHLSRGEVLARLGSRIEESGAPKKSRLAYPGIDTVEC